MSRFWPIFRNSAAALGLIAVVAFAMLWLAGAFRSGKVSPGRVVSAPPPPAGTAFPVTRLVRPHFADLVGSVQAEVRATVTGRLVANILEVRVRAGDHVKKGDVLILLDDRDLTARVGQATEALRAAEAKRDLAKIELDRLTELVEKNVASVYEMEQWRAQHAAAAADVGRLQQSLSETQVALSDAIVRAPLDGIVIDRQAEPGDQASPARPLLSIYDPAHLRLEAYARETYVGQLPLGQEVMLFIDAIRQQRMGTAHEIVPAADPLSRSFLIKVKIADPSGLYPGMFGRVRLPLEPQERLEIPLAAVRNVGQLSLVHALVDGRAERRAVRVGHSFGDRIEILAGLAEGEQVLVSEK